MSIWNSRSISGKLTRMNLVVSGTALLLAYAFFLVYDLVSIRQNLIHSLNSEAAIIGANCVTAITFDDPQTAEQTLSALRESPHVLVAVVLRSDGTVFARYARSHSAVPAIHPRLGPDETSGYWNEGSNVLLGRKIIYLDHTVGSVYVLAQTGDLSHQVGQIGIISGCIVVLCFLASLAATSTVRKLLTRPLSDLAETAQVVTRDRDYTVRARTPRGGDELALLVRSFNEMLEQIQQRDRALEESRVVLEQRVEERTVELTAANKELEAFSYSVAHDLRGPLQHISNVTYLLEQSCSGEDAECGRLIERLFESNRRMSALIEDLLNLSRATSTPLHRSAINLSQMVATIVDNLKTDDPTRQVEVTIAKGAHVIADEGLITLVLENLLRNAWKYTSRSANARIEFGFYEDNGSTVYYVRDNGVGFNPRYADRLFRPFQRLHSQGEFPGTGVGLATVSRIIGRHEGAIWAKGNIDQGAEFLFTLPYGTDS